MKPWEKYGQAASTGGKPWEKYAAPKAEPTEGPSTLDRFGNAALGAVQGVTANLGDEIGGVGNAAIDAVGRAVGLGKDSTFGEDYKQYRDISRGLNKKAQAESKGEYGFGEILGSMGIPMGNVGTVGKAAAKLGGMGALTGFGTSEETGGALARDTAIGGIIGGGLGAIGEKAGQKISSVASKIPGALERAGLRNVTKATFRPTPKQFDELIKSGDDQRLAKAVRESGGGRLFDSPESSAEKIRSSIEDSGGKLDEIYKQADASGASLSADDFLSTIGNRIDSFKSDPSLRELIPKFERKGTNVIEAFGDTPVGFQQARKYVGNEQNAFDKGGSNLALKQEKGLAMDLRKMLSGKIDEQLPGSNISAENKRLSSLLDASELADRNTGRQAGHRAISLSDAVLGAGGFASGQGEGYGDNIAGLAGAIALKRGLSKYGRQALASGQLQGALGATQLMKLLEKGTPVAQVIQQATALGIPREVIEFIQQEKE